MKNTSNPTNFYQPLTLYQNDTDTSPSNPNTVTHLTDHVPQKTHKKPTQKLPNRQTSDTCKANTDRHTQGPPKITSDQTTQETTPKTQASRVSNLTTDPHQPQIILRGTYNNHPAKILLDCGATGNFISRKYVATHKLPTSSRTPLDITLADGRTQETCATRTNPFNLHMGSYSTWTGLDLTTLNSDYDIILGMPWLTETNPKIDWVNCQLTIHQAHHSILLHAIDSPMQHVISALQFARLTKTCKYYLVLPGNSTMANFLVIH